MSTTKKKSALPLDELAADAAVKKKPKITLQAVTAMASTMEELNKKWVDKLEDAKAIKEQYDKLAFEQLPEAMQMLGIKTLGLISGNDIRIAEIITCKITDEKTEAAHKWLRDNGHGDLIKNVVTITFGKEEDRYADKAYEELQEMPHSALTREEKVHPQTLKAFVTERIRDPATPLPTELLGIGIINIAKLEQKKVKK